MVINLTLPFSKRTHHIAFSLGNGVVGVKIGNRATICQLNLFAYQPDCIRAKMNISNRDADHRDWRGFFGNEVP